MQVSSTSRIQASNPSSPTVIPSAYLIICSTTNRTSCWYCPPVMYAPIQLKQCAGTVLHGSTLFVSAASLQLRHGLQLAPPPRLQYGGVTPVTLENTANKIIDSISRARRTISPIMIICSSGRRRCRIFLLEPPRCEREKGSERGRERES